MTTSEAARFPARRIALYAGVFVAVVVAVWLASFVPDADWHGTFDGVARSLFQNRSPYSQPGLKSPPWAAVLLAPFALFPQQIARGLMLVFTLGVWLYAAWRMQAPRLAVIAMLVSPTAIGSLLAANIDALVLLGVFLPATWGLFLLVLKPQIGFGPGLFDAVEAWRERRIRGIVLTFAPVVIGVVISAILFPVWIQRLEVQTASVWNRTLFPFGVPLGLALLWLSFRRRNAMFALAATPFLAPYVSFPTYVVVQLGLLHPDVDRVVPRTWLQILLCAVLWFLMLTFHL